MGNEKFKIKIHLSRKNRWACVSVFEIGGGTSGFAGFSTADDILKMAKRMMMRKITI